jgi:molecular chaperone DnaK (HSP70)
MLHMLLTASILFLSHVFRSLVALGAKERLLGEAAAGQYVMNPKSTLSEFKVASRCFSSVLTCSQRLMGRKFSAPDVQEELKNVLFKTKELPNGNVGVEV